MKAKNPVRPIRTVRSRIDDSGVVKYINRILVGTPTIGMVFDVDEDGAMERRLGIGSGLPNAPRASVGPIDDDKCEGEDCDCMVTITSEGEAMNYCGPFSPSADIYLRSWRER